jgi:hypothetical protein
MSRPVEKLQCVVRDSPAMFGNAQVSSGFKPWHSLLLLGACALPAGLSLGGEHQAGGPGPDKSRYNLFNPTPPGLMRPMETDRPDRTESAYTVDAGHFQFEMDLATYSYDRDRSGGGDTRTDGWAIAPVNLKIGLLNNVDFQLVLDSYGTVRVEDRLGGTLEKRSGFGDVTTRLKVNLWGNDGGRTALAMMPFVKFPTNQDDLGNDAVEGGVIFPLAIELPHGWGLGAQTEVDFLRDDAGSGYHAVFVNTITFNHDIVGDLAGYVEFFSEVSTQRDTPWVGTFDLGVTYALTENIQFDAGINIGVTKSAEDFNPFLGLSWRF